MMIPPLPGRVISGVFSSADASGLSEANSRFALYDTSRNAISSLAANEQVIITDIQVIVEDGLAVNVYDGADTSVAAGENIASATLPDGGGFVRSLQTPHFCTLATFPKIKTSGAGQINAHINGYIVRHGQ